MAIENKKNNRGLDVEEMLSKSETFIEKNKKMIIGVIAAIVVIVAAVIIYKNYIKDPKEKAAQAAIFKGQNYFEAQQYELALNGDSIDFIGFIKAADEYSGTEAGDLANYYAGVSLARTGKYEEAIKYLAKFDKGDRFITPAARAVEGNCYAALENYEKAASMLVKAAEMSDSFSVSPIWLKQAGEIYEKMGKNEQAANVYRTIKDKYSSSMVARDIDKYIERATAIAK